MPNGSTVFVDTNVLLYAQDPREPARRKAAESWLAACWQGQCGRLSTQVLNELYANLRRVAPSLPVEQARAMVQRYRAWGAVPVDDALVDDAWRLQDRYSFSFWDALIVASAQAQGCDYLLSEDMQHEQRVDALQILNPFIATPDRLEQRP